MPQLKAKDLAAVLGTLPEDIKIHLQMNPRKVVLAGGFIRDTVTGDKPNDIDLFISTPELAQSLSAEYAQTTKAKNKVVKSRNAYNLEVPGSHHIQWIFTYPFNAHYEWISPGLSVVENFDFIMSMAALWFGADGDWSTYCNEDFYKDTQNRALVFAGSKPETAIKRAIKFAARGWTIDDENLSELLSDMTEGRVSPEQMAEVMNGGTYSDAPETNADVTAPVVTTTADWTVPNTWGNWSGNSIVGTLTARNFGSTPNVANEPIRGVNPSSFILDEVPSVLSRDSFNRAVDTLLGVTQTNHETTEPETGR